MLTPAQQKYCRVCRITGIILLVLSIAMFMLGVGLFSYQGGSLNPPVSDAGTYSFILWLPTVLLAAILISVKPKKER